ncbi:MAG: outer membrane beta-barrel protein [Gemmatimonadetes bacterium]|nr:outer membrane beta-barrel protein [Gemmatimonadota bacterium]
MKRTIALFALLLVGAAAPAAAQVGGRLSVQPYVGYGFFGTLPVNGPQLEESVAYGGRAAFKLSDQFALYGNFQRSQPNEAGTLRRKIDVDHWSTGAEFSFVPRGGAEGMLPIILEAGLGQVRYGDQGLFGEKDTDLLANIGIASALELSRNFAIRYGANDYISNYNGRGLTNQIFVQVGAEITF